MPGETLHFSCDAPEVGRGRLHQRRPLHSPFRLSRFGAPYTYPAAFVWLKGEYSTNDAMTAIFVSSHHPIPRQPGSRDNLGPFLNVVTWILLITSALAVVTRLITKRALKRRVDVDDAFVLLALVSEPTILLCIPRLTIGAQITSIGSGASVSIQVANGLGRNFSTLVEKEVEAYLKVCCRRHCTDVVSITLTDISFCRPNMRTKYSTSRP